MPPTIIIPGEKDIIQKVLDSKNTIQKQRNIHERQWLVNLAFLYGKTNFIAENRKISSGLEDRIMWELKSEERKNKVKRTSNYILPLYRSLLARLLLMKSHTTVDPTTSSEKDKAVARVSSEVIEDFWQMCNKGNPLLCRKYSGMVLTLAQLFKFMLVFGKGYLKPYFNPKTIAKTRLSGEIIEGEIGEVECQVLSPFDVFEDRLGMHIIEQRILPIEIIKSIYGVTVEPEKVTVSDTEQQLLNMLEGSDLESKNQEAAKIYEFWGIPTEKYPGGRHIITTDNKLIADDVIPPEYKKRLPYFGFDYLDLMFTGYPQGMVDQLISLQEEYNYTITRIHSYKKWFAGKLKVPKKCQLEQKYDDEIGQIIYYEQGYGEPHFETPPNPPTFLVEELIRIRKDMEDVASVHDSGMGRLPQQIKSGVAIENLNELDNNSLMPILMATEQKLGFFAETVLDIVEARYTEPRILKIAGENLGADVMTFMGSDVAGNKRIKVSIGSNMPITKSERQMFLMGLADKGYIPKTKALELMEFGDISGLYSDLDENAQKIEIGEMIKGVQVEPHDWEDHTIHLKVISDFLKGEQFKKTPPELQQILLQHRGIHQKFLQVEMQSAAQMSQQTPQGGAA